MEPSSLRNRPSRTGSFPSRTGGDGRLARQAARGNRAAFATIFTRHQDELFRYCRSILGDDHDATDALQSTMVKALEKLPGETRRIALRPWLFRIAHNESIDLIRARRPHLDLDAAVDVSDRVSSSELEVRERLRALSADLHELTEQQRGALLMRELVGLSFAETATALAISPAAAKQSVYEARQALLTREAGREMSCDALCRSISDGDRRTLRGKAVQAHLADCADCRAFAEALRRRPDDLGMLVPPLPFVAVLAGAGGSGAAVGAGVVASGSGGGGFLGGLFSSVSASVGGKIAVAAVATGAVAVGGTAVVVDHRDGGGGASRPASGSGASTVQQAAAGPTPAAVPGTTTTAAASAPPTTTTRAAPASRARIEVGTERAGKAGATVSPGSAGGTASGSVARAAGTGASSASAAPGGAPEAGADAASTADTAAERESADADARADALAAKREAKEARDAAKADAEKAKKARDAKAQDTKAGGAKTEPDNAGDADAGDAKAKADKAQADKAQADKAQADKAKDAKADDAMDTSGAASEDAGTGTSSTATPPSGG